MSTLKNVFEQFEAEEITPATYIKNQFNRYSSIVEEMKDEEANLIYTLITDKLVYLLDLELNDAFDIDTAETRVKAILTDNILKLGTEFRMLSKAFDKDLATTHSQRKGNVIDNTDIDNSAVESDITSFTHYENIVMRLEYIKDNSKNFTDIQKEFIPLIKFLGGM